MRGFFRPSVHTFLFSRYVLFFFIYFIATLFIYLFIFGCVGSSVRARAISSCGKRGPLFIAVRGPLTIAASLVAEHRLQMHRLSSCGSRAQLLRGMWDLPRPGLEPVSPALAGRFSATAPPGKPSRYVLSGTLGCSQSFIFFFPTYALLGGQVKPGDTLSFIIIYKVLA